MTIQVYGATRKRSLGDPSQMMSRAHGEIIIFGATDDARYTEW
jgi:hypothetical protein